MTATRAPLEGPAQLRWELTDDRGVADAQPELFDTVRREVGRGEFRGMEFLHVRARRIINEIPPSFLPFRHTINAYRGCSHACTYCFARPTHAYLGLNTGVDFDQRIVVKVNAIERLRAELHPARWAGHPIAMGTNTDPYQRVEGKYRLTRGLVETLVEHGNPFSVLTKSTLVLRDLDLLAEGARGADVRVSLSIGTLDEQVWRETEPGTPHPRRRLRAIEALAAAGIPTGVLVGPVLPGRSDAPEQLEEVARAAVEAGAQTVGTVLLHLRPGVKEHYLGTLARDRPDLLERHAALYRGANAPRAERERVARTVAVAVRRAGGRAEDVGAEVMAARRAHPAGSTRDAPSGVALVEADAAVGADRPAQLSLTL